MTASPSVQVKLAIETHDLWRIYKSGALEVPALRGIDLSIPAGAFVAVKGRSGSGKTTLVNCIGGLDHPTRGSVRVMGTDLSGMTEEQLTTWRRDNVGFIFQSFGLIATFSAFENVEMMMQIAGAPFEERRKRTEFCLDLVGLKKWQHHRPFELSGGQQQRVAIARAIANHPPLILADEPTGELDSTTAREILALFRNIIQEEGATMLMVSHDPLVDEYVDEVIQLRDGQVFRG